MAVERMVLLLALASLLAVNAATTQPSSPSSGSFVEWLATQSSTDAKTASSYYEEVEKESACLKTISIGNCRPLNADGTRNYIEIDLACCSTETGDKYHTDYTQLRAEKVVVGGCSFTEERFPGGPIAYEGGTTLAGTFSGICDSKAESSECGSPLCGGITLIVSGKILSYNNVAFTGGVAEILTTCPPETRSKSPLKALLERAAKGPVTPAQDAPAAYSVGSGDIYVGNFQVVSTKHKLPFKTGRFEQVIATGESYKAVTTVPEKAFVADDLTITLDFYKSGGYY